MQNITTSLDSVTWRIVLNLTGLAVVGSERGLACV